MLAAVRIDLHVHSSASDGTDAPAEVIRRAAAAGLDVLALTDHDTQAGVAEARAALPPGLTLVPGMELSCQLDGRSVHLLCYLFDPDDPALRAETAQVRDDRVYRARAMTQRLRELGADVSWEQVTAIAGDAVVGRPHLARALAASGAIADPADAFTAEWIGDGGRAFVDRYAPGLARAVGLVRAAGGVPVLAHPRSPGYEIPNAVIAELAGAGLAGIEVFHPDHDAARAGPADRAGQVTGPDQHRRQRRPRDVHPERAGRAVPAGHGLGTGDDACAGVRAAARAGRDTAVTFFFQAFVTLFVIIDPPGIVPVFLGLTRGRPVAHQAAPRLAGRRRGVRGHRRVRAVRTGDPDLHAGPDRRARGGGRAAAPAGLAAAADREDGRADLRRAREDQRGVRAARHAAARRARRDRGDDAVRPAREHRSLEGVALALAILAVAVCAWAVMRFAAVIHRVLTDNGVELLTRIAGLLLAAIAVQLVAQSALAFAAQAP